MLGKEWLLSRQIADAQEQASNVYLSCNKYDMDLDILPHFFYFHSYPISYRISSNLKKFLFFWYFILYPFFIVFMSSNIKIKMKTENPECMTWRKQNV